MELTISLPELRYQYFKFRCLSSFLCFSPESFFWLASHTRNHLLAASLNPALVSATCVVQLHYVEVIWSLKSMFTYCVNASAFTTRPVCVYISNQEHIQHPTTVPTSWDYISFVFTSGYMGSEVNKRRNKYENRLCR